MAKLCVDAENVGLPRNLKYFCCSSCFLSVWKKHRSYQTNKSRSPLDSKTEIERMFPDPEETPDQEWKMVSRNKTYVPTEEDVGYTLKVECVAKGIDGSKIASQSTTTEVVLPVPPPPPMRRQVAHKYPGNGTDSTIRVVTYNVLAEIYTNKQMYPYCPLWALSWNFRRRNLMRQMTQFDADIYCLQEVQADRFEQFFYPTFRANGYEGLYKKKTREAMGRKGKVDGCAIFFKANRFQLREKYVIEFNDAAMAMARAGKLVPNQGTLNEMEMSETLSRVMKDNIAQVVVLETLPSGMDKGGRQFCLCNTHIFWDPEYADVKLWQSAMLLKELEKFNVGRKLPLILCGDFNSLPDSSVYEFLSTGQVRAIHPDLKRDPLGITSKASDFRHDLQLVSTHVSVTGSEPQFTNYTRDFVGTLDYIFSTPRLHPVSMFEIPNEETLRKHNDSPLPNLQYPSDHIALCADYQFMDKAPMVMNQTQNVPAMRQGGFRMGQMRAPQHNQQVPFAAQQWNLGMHTTAASQAWRSQ